MSTSPSLGRVRKHAHVVVLAALGALIVGTAAARAALVEYEWVQTSCTGAACGATAQGLWTFQEEAVQRGSATYFALRDTYPNLVPDGVGTFGFTLGQFSLQGFSFGPLTWTNANSVWGLGSTDLGGIYDIQFSGDRTRIAAIAQRTVIGHFYDDADSTIFDLAPRNPTIHIDVMPNAIEYYHNTGSEPIGPEGIPVIPGATTFTGEWRVVEAPTPIPEPGSAALIGIVVVAAALGARRTPRPTPMPKVRGASRL